MKITLDKNKKAPVIKPVNGVQNGPVTYDFLIDTTEYFRAAHFPYSRLHDTEMLYGAGDFVNVLLTPSVDSTVMLPVNHTLTLSAMVSNVTLAPALSATERSYSIGDSNSLSPPVHPATLSLNDQS